MRSRPSGPSTRGSVPKSALRGDGPVEGPLGAGAPRSHHHEGPFDGPPSMEPLRGAGPEVQSGGAVSPMEAPKGRRRESSSGEPPSVTPLRGARSVKVTRRSGPPAGGPEGSPPGVALRWAARRRCAPKSTPGWRARSEPGRMLEERVFRGLSLIRNPCNLPAVVSRQWEPILS